MLARPDVLVLAAGGILGEAWMSGVLAGAQVAGGIDFRRCDAFVGTSAGSIVAARLSAGLPPRRPKDQGPDGDADTAPRNKAPGPDGAPEPARRPEEAPVGRALAGARRLALARRAARLAALATAPAAGPLLAAGAPVGARLRALALARAPSRGETLTHLRDEIARTGARFDGRLRICCVDRATGRRVVFGAPGAPPAEVADAVAASCAVPWLFSPVRIGDREYVDGGVWSLTNLDVAPAGRDTEVLCLNPSASLALAGASPLGALRAAGAAASEVEALALRARGARVRIVGPDRAAARLLAADPMDRRPARAVHAAGYRQGLALARADT